MSKFDPSAIIPDRSCPYCKGGRNHSKTQRDGCKKLGAVKNGSNGASASTSNNQKK